MAVFEGGRRIGSLSSGCIEGDIAAQALRRLRSGRPEMVRYGRGSPFKDLLLPCGGGMDVLLVPHPDRDVLLRLEERRAERRTCTLAISIESGDLEVLDALPAKDDSARLMVCFEPPPAFIVCGAGTEASTFARLSKTAGYKTLLLSPDRRTLNDAMIAGCETEELTRPHLPASIKVDDRTAIVLFFHDHDWEPPILIGALKSPAFYIGAQGSRRARDLRMNTLRDLGMTEADGARISGPVGLIPSARDPVTLAVSVLAEVLAKAMPEPRL